MIQDIVSNVISTKYVHSDECTMSRKDRNDAND